MAKRGDQKTKDPNFAETLEQVLRLYKAGLSAWQIAKQVDWSYNTIVKYLKKKGIFDIERDRRSIITGRKSQVAARIEPYLDEIYNKYIAGAQITDLSREYSVSKGYLGEILRRHDLILNPQVGERNRTYGRTPRSKYGVGPYEFIEIWQTSETVEEAVRRTGMPRQAVYSRAYVYKSKGVPLKKLQRGSVSWLDFDDMKNFAALLIEEESDNG